MASRSPSIDAGTPDAAQGQDTRLQGAAGRMARTSLAGVGPVTATAASTEKQTAPLPVQTRVDDGQPDLLNTFSRGAAQLASSADDGKDEEKIPARAGGPARSGPSPAFGVPRAPAARPRTVHPADLIRRGPGDDAREPAAPQLRRVRTVQATNTRGWSGEAGSVGAVVGLLLGTVATVATIATGGVAAMFGGVILAGAMLACGGASALAFPGDNRPQKANLDAALRSLDAAGERFTEDEAGRLAAVSDAQWRALLPVPSWHAADEAAQQKQREHLVVAVARHGYARASQWKAFAKELGQLTPDEASRLDSVTPERRKALLAAPEDLATDRAARRALRRTLVFNVGRHGLDYTLKNKQKVIDAVRSGALAGEATDLDLLQPRFDGPDGAKLIGPSVQDLMDSVTDEMDQALDHACYRDPDGKTWGLSKTFVDDVNRQLRPLLTDRDGRGTELGQRPKDTPLNVAGVEAALKGYVGDRDGDGATVARNLSHYLNQNPSNALVNPILGPVSSRDGATMSMKPRPKKWEIRVREQDDGSYVVSYEREADIEAVLDGKTRLSTVPGSEMKARMSIQLQREDLAKGNHKFEWVERPYYEVHIRGYSKSEQASLQVSLFDPGDISQARALRPGQAVSHPSARRDKAAALGQQESRQSIALGGDAQPRQLGGPDGRHLTGPSNEEYRNAIRNKLAVLRFKPDHEYPYLHERCAGDFGRLMPIELSDEQGDKTTFTVIPNSPPEVVAKDMRALHDQLTRLTGHDADLASRLSTYLTQDGFTRLMEEATAALRTKDARWLIGTVDPLHAPKVRRDQSDESGAWILTFEADFGINALTPVGTEGEVKLLDPKQNRLIAGMAIRVTADDLRAGEGNFTWAQEPHYDITWSEHSGAEPQPAAQVTDH
jgi:hypothetical protein